MRDGNAMIRMEKIRVRDLSLPETGVYAERRESQLMHALEPEPGLFIAESPNVILRALAAGYEPVSFLVQAGAQEREAEEILRQYCDESAAVADDAQRSDRSPAGADAARGDGSALADDAKLAGGSRTPDDALRAVSSAGSDDAHRMPVYVAEEPVMRQLTGYAMTRGLLCAMRRKRPLRAEEVGALCAGANRVVVAEDVENPTNLGAIFRSAAGLGMDAVLLTPGCTDPLYRRCIRVSMGTVFQIPWAFLPEEDYAWPERGMERLHAQGFQTAAMALTDRSTGIDDPALTACKKLAVILGTEGDGLRRETIAACDYTVRIPMAHGVDSLNVAAAGAVAFWVLGKQG